MEVLLHVEQASSQKGNGFVFFHVVGFYTWSRNLPPQALCIWVGKWVFVLSAPTVLASPRWKFPIIHKQNLMGV